MKGASNYINQIGLQLSSLWFVLLILCLKFLIRKWRGQNEVNVSRRASSRLYLQKLNAPSQVKRKDMDSSSDFLII